MNKESNKQDKKEDTNIKAVAVDVDVQVRGLNAILLTISASAGRFTTNKYKIKKAHFTPMTVQIDFCMMTFFTTSALYTICYRVFHI